MKSVRVNITLPDVLLSEIDKFADEHQFTRSTLLQVAVAQYMRADNMMPSVQEAFALMGSLAKRAAAGGVDSAEYEKELRELESLNEKFQQAASDEQAVQKVKGNGPIKSGRSRKCWHRW